MKKGFGVITLITMLSLVFVAMAMAGKSSSELGKELFHDATLGASTNDTSCNTCHENGKGLEDAAANPKLIKAINRCITGPLGGEKIDGRSIQMRSLKMYTQSLGSGS